MDEPVWAGINWSWLANINLLQVAIVIVALYVVVRLLVKFWPWLRKVMALTEALSKLPAFMARTDDTLAAQNVKIAEIHHEVNYNNGSSVKDAVDRVELGVKGLYERVEASDVAAAAAAAQLKQIERTIPRRSHHGNENDDQH